MKARSFLVVEVDDLVLLQALVVATVEPVNRLNDLEDPFVVGRFFKESNREIAVFLQVVGETLALEVTRVEQLVLQSGEEFRIERVA